MRLLYEAQNSIDGHLLVELLRQEGLFARMDGQYLQGAVGELQAMGVVRVMVNEDSYDAARKVVDAWESGGIPPISESDWQEKE